MQPPRAGRARPDPRPGRRRAARCGGRARPGSSTSTWTSSTARRASRSTTGARSLDGALALEPDHVSAYALTVEPGTPLGQDIARGRSRTRPDDDDQAEKYEIADDTLRAAGFEWYEISNWARPGGECRHNLLYWEQGDYLAIGAAAHGHADGRRWWNLRTPERYIAAIQAGASTEAGRGAPRRRRPGRGGALLAIRTRGRHPDPGPRRPRPSTELAADGLVEPRADRIVLTRRGRLLASRGHRPGCSPCWRQLRLGPLGSSR